MSCRDTELYRAVCLLLNLIAGDVFEAIKLGRFDLLVSVYNTYIFVYLNKFGLLHSWGVQNGHF